MTDKGCESRQMGRDTDKNNCKKMRCVPKEDVESNRKVQARNLRDHWTARLMLALDTRTSGVSACPPVLCWCTAVRECQAASVTCNSKYGNKLPLPPQLCSKHASRNGDKHINYEHVACYKRNQTWPVMFRDRLVGSACESQRSENCHLSSRSPATLWTPESSEANKLCK